MSDTERVENDTPSNGDDVMRALCDTEGMSVPERAEFWLQGLAWVENKGRHDTWGASRDRAARRSKIPLTIAKRIWQRWRDMNDVGGDALLKLMLAYEEACQKQEAAIEAYRSERLKLKAERHAVGNRPAGSSLGTDAARD